MRANTGQHCEGRSKVGDTNRRRCEGLEIPKPDGGKRMLGIPTVTDRAIQQAIARVLTPIFDPTFSDSSFGFRPGRNAHQAIRQVHATVKDGYRIAVDIDRAKFFDTVNHDMLMGLPGRTIDDKRLPALIGRYLRAGVLVGERIEPSGIGTPPGRPLSPLLANILLHQLDQELERRVLGFTIQGNKIRWTDKALANFEHRVGELTGRSWGVSMEYRLHKLGQYVRG
jgi:RNA-directed DNA polymerase